MGGRDRRRRNAAQTSSPGAAAQQNDLDSPVRTGSASHLQAQTVPLHTALPTDGTDVAVQRRAVVRVIAGVGC
jgi:hypothetical protein